MPFNCSRVRFVATRRTTEELYETMRDAIAYLRANPSHTPAQAARSVGMSESRFTHAFRRWVGISPKRFLTHLTHERAKTLLSTSHTVLDASVKAGLSGPGRLHARMVEHDAVSPGEYKRGMFEIQYGIHRSPFGYCVIGTTSRGVCALSFIEQPRDAAAKHSIKSIWPKATLVRNDRSTAMFMRKIFDATQRGKALPLMVRGTNFQIQVWRALLSIPEGRIASYAHIARHIGKPRAVRAVGTAIGANPIAFLIPCHRVLTSDGKLGGYRWDPKRKDALLTWEASRR